MVTLTSHSPAETWALGEAWGRAATPGWVIGLTGDLGAGKTHLVKGIAAGLGSGARVHSPTFSLVNEYGGGRCRLFHLDLYRLETLDQIRRAGLEEYLFSTAGVTVIEWFDRWREGELTAATQAVTQGTDGAPLFSGPERAGTPPTLAAGVALSRPGHPGLRRVWLEVLNPTDRRIRYEDTGT